MSIRWNFVEGYEGDTSYWSWRIVNVDGTIETQSASFSTYGQAVSEAIKNGFQPRLQHWVVATRHTITHFRPGQAPLTVPVADTPPVPVPRKGGDGQANSPRETPDDAPSPRHRREPH